MNGVAPGRERPPDLGYGPHFGEERPLVGRHGPGAIFFPHCTLGCLVCQNDETSLEGRGERVTGADLAAVIPELQAVGCRTIDLAPPTHDVPRILAAVAIAAE